MLLRRQGISNHDIDYVEPRIIGHPLAKGYNGARNNM